MAKKAPKVVSPVRTTPVRGSAIPKVPASQPTTPVAREITQDMIAQRAYEIWQSGQGGSDFDNWVRAERELRAI